MFWVASGGSQNIKGLNVGHGQCRKSDVKIKHPIKLSQPAKCNNRASGTGLSICGLPDGQTEDSQQQHSPDYEAGKVKLKNMQDVFMFSPIKHNLN